MLFGTQNTSAHVRKTNFKNQREAGRFDVSPTQFKPIHAKTLFSRRVLVAGSVVLDLAAMSMAFGGHGAYGAIPTHASTMNPLLGSTCADLVAVRSICSDSPHVAR